MMSFLLGGCLSSRLLSRSADDGFPAWLNSPQRPVSGSLYSVQLDKRLNGALPSAPQACPLFVVHVSGPHSLRNLSWTQKTSEAQSRIARGSESGEKKPLTLSCRQIQTLTAARIRPSFTIFIYLCIFWTVFTSNTSQAFYLIINNPWFCFCFLLFLYFSDFFPPVFQ